MSKIDLLNQQLITETAKREQLTEIIVAISEMTGVSVEDMVGRGKKRNVTDARHLFYYITKIQLTHMFTLDDIGSFLGYRNHATVLCGRTRAEELIEFNKPFQRVFKKLATHFNLITQFMTSEERQAAIALIDTNIERLEMWLSTHPINPYRGKVLQDIRELKAERKRLIELEQKAA